MKTIIRSALGSMIQACLETKRPVVIKPNTTLNQKLNIFPNELFTEDFQPFTQYVVIGNNGHVMQIGQNQIPKLKPVPHKPQHSGLYNQMPFVLRRLDDDLTPVERARYRLRRLETHGGEVHAAYYGRVLNTQNATAQLELRTVINGNVTVTPFEHTAQDLNPAKPVIQPGYVLDTTGDYIAAYVPAQFVMTTDDMREYSDACNIIYGEEGYAVISEIGLAAGVDRGLIVDNAGTPLAYTEAVGVMITNFLTASYSADFFANGFTLDMNIGSSEPLLEFQAQP